MALVHLLRQLHVCFPQPRLPPCANVHPLTAHPALAVAIWDLGDSRRSPGEPRESGQHTHPPFLQYSN